MAIKNAERRRCRAAAALLFVIAIALASLLAFDLENSEKALDPPTPAVTNPPKQGLSLPSGEMATNIMDFGATGDGKTSDQAAWSAAVKATPPGGILFLPPGRAFALPEQVTLRSPLTIVGYGATVVKPPTTESLARWFVLDAPDVVIEGVTFSDPSGLVPGDVIASRGTHTGIEVRDSTFLAKSSVGMRLADIREAVVSGNTFSGVRGAVYVSGAAENVVVRGNTVRQWRDYGVHLFGTGSGSPSNVDVVGNRITNLAPGGYPRYAIHTARGTGDGRLTSIRLLGNVVLGPGRSHASSPGGTADQISVHQADNVLIQGNVSRDSGDMGITVESCRDALVTGNTVTGSDASGIAVFTDAIDVTVTDNILLDNGVDRNGSRDPAGRAGVRLSTSKESTGPSRVVVRNNVTGNTISKQTQMYGISIDSSAQVTTAHNTDTGNAVSLYFDQTADEEIL